METFRDPSLVVTVRSDALSGSVISPDAKHLIEQLLIVDAPRRAAPLPTPIPHCDTDSGRGGEGTGRCNILEHAFFAGVDWGLLESKRGVPPPLPLSYAEPMQVAPPAATP